MFVLRTDLHASRNSWCHDKSMLIINIKTKPSRMSCCFQQLKNTCNMLEKKHIGMRSV